VIFIIEKIAKFLSRLGVMLLALFGVRYLLAFIGVIIPLEWFLIMSFGMMGLYGIIFLVFYIIYINLF